LIKIAQYFVSWQEELKSFNRSINTVIAYAQDFLDFKNFYEDYHNTELSIDNFKTITPQDIRAWMMHQRKKQKNIRSSARGLAGLKNFSQFLLNLEVINDHAFFHSRSPKLQKTPTLTGKIVTHSFAMKTCKIYETFNDKELKILISCFTNVGVNVEKVWSFFSLFARNAKGLIDSQKIGVIHIAKQIFY
jgi:site-specific recombinase XerD